MNVDAFIAQLRRDEAGRNGPSIYASDRIFALLHRLDKVQRERDELRIAIMGGRADPSVTHGQFIEMAKSTEAARRGCLARAEAAERALEEAEKVIKPFADLAEFYQMDARDEEAADGAVPDVYHLRAARKWMESRHD